jgi:hypothetical protein
LKKIKYVERKKILNVIIAKGGLMGAAARMYINDDQKSDGFIRECYEQCHNKSAQELWGKELVSEIEKYILNSVFYSEKSSLLDVESS